MKILSAVPLTALALLSGCADEKPSNALFEKTINQFIEKEGICLPLVLNVQNFQSPETFSQIALGSPLIQLHETDRKGNAINQSARKQMDLLTDKGFYQKSKSTLPAKAGSSEQIQITRYELTEDGKKIVRTQAKRLPLFCIGKQKVEKIHWYTEPSPSNGMTVSRVSYDARFLPEKWLSDLLKAGGGSKLPLAETQTLSATVVKTSEGWKDSRELR